MYIQMKKLSLSMLKFFLLFFVSYSSLGQEITCINPVNCETQNEALNQYDFKSVALIDEDNGWILSSSGVLFCMHEGGLSIDKNFDHPIQAIDVVHENLTWAIANNEFYKFNGTNWQKEASDLSLKFTEIFAIDANHGYGIGYKMFAKYEYGVWTEIELPVELENMYDLQFIDKNTGWLTSVSAVYKYKNGIFSKTNTIQGPLKSLSFTDETEGWMSNSVNLLHFQNNEWQVDSTVRELAFVESVTMTDNEHGWLAGTVPYDHSNPFVAAKYIDGEWIKNTDISLNNQTVTDIDLITPDKGLIVGKKGLILRIGTSDVIANVPNNFDATEELAYSITPNPSTKIIYIQNGSSPAKDQAIEVIDDKGKMYINTIYEKNTGLNIDALPKGLYFLRLKTDQVSLKFIKE